MFSLYQWVFATFTQSILEYSTNINYSLITLFHYPYHLTGETKLKAKLKSRVPHNSCIQRRRLCVSKTVTNEQAARNKKFGLDFSELYHVLATSLKIRKDWLVSGVLNMRTEFKYPGCCYSLPLDTSFGNFPAEIKLEVISILPDIAKFLFNLLTEVQDKKTRPRCPIAIFLNVCISTMHC